MSYETLTYEVADHVAVLTYNRPEQRNAIGASAFKEGKVPQWPNHGL